MNVVVVAQISTKKRDRKVVSTKLYDEIVNAKKKEIYKWPVATYDAKDTKSRKKRKELAPSHTAFTK